MFLSLATGIIFITGLLLFYRALSRFESSRVVPAIGSLTALFTFVLIYLFSFGQEVLGGYEIAAFFLLLLGSFLITYEKDKKVSLESFKAAAIASFPLALYMVLTKFVYLGQEFWNGLIWIRIGGFLAALLLVFLFPSVRTEIIKRKKIIPQKAYLLFFSQGFGAGANLLLNWAIALAPLAYLSLINALIGTQYAFLLILTVILSLKFPDILKEKISKEILIQKITAILLIIVGLSLISL